jgi:pimeloyl-ACP methyl ester carboxylesterase
MPRQSGARSHDGFRYLLLHGIPTRNVPWREVTPRVVDAGYRVIAPDLAGFGRSDAPGEVETHVGNQATSSTGAPVRRRRAIS